MITETKLITKHSKIPFIWPHMLQTIKFSYQTVPTATEVLTGKFCYSSYTWAVQLKRERSTPFEYLLHLLVEGHQGPLLCSLEYSLLKKLMENVITHEEIPQQLMNRHSWKLCLYYWQSFFSSKKKKQKISCLGNTLLKC